MGISILILTKNEEQDLPSCLDSLAEFDDIQVIDSGSNDRTKEIAHQRGAVVWNHEFESFGKQRNWALDHCKIRHSWILFLDADERVTPEFSCALTEATSRAADDVAGFFCCWKLFLNERWLKRSDNFPKWQFRLMRKGRARFTDFGHGQKEGEVLGAIKYLQEPYLHKPFSRGWEHWEMKHRRYAIQEAVARTSKIFGLKEILSPHSSKRNPALKSFLTRLPGWPKLRFIHTYLLNGGFLEGKEGLEYCGRMQWFEKEVQREMTRLRRRNRT